MKIEICAFYVGGSLIATAIKKSHWFRSIISLLSITYTNQFGLLKKTFVRSLISLYHNIYSISHMIKTGSKTHIKNE